MRAERCARLAMVVGTLWACVPFQVHAQSSNEVAAEALFHDARKLLEAGQYREACEKLEASRRLDPAPGTLLNLARCREKSGQTATAWAIYHDVIRASTGPGQADREKVARERITALEPTLPRLTIVVSPDARAANVQLRRDGVALPPEIFGLTVPVDPGEHVVDATASGKRPWSTKVNLVERATATITVPALAPLLSSDRSPSPPNEKDAKHLESSDSEQRTWNAGKTFAVMLGAVGVAGLTVSTIEWLRFDQKKQDAANACPASGCYATDHDAASTYHSEASSARTIAVASGVIGGASLIGATVLWFSSGTRTGAASNVTVAPVIGARELGLGLAGAW